MWTAARTREVEPVQTVFEQGGADIFRTKGDQFFAILCKRLLWTAPHDCSPNKNKNDATLKIK